MRSGQLLLGILTGLYLSRCWNPGARSKKQFDKYADDPVEWMKAAEAAYAGSQMLFASDNALVWFPAAILGHHSLEMFLKAALIRHGHKAGYGKAFGHNLRKLARTLSHHVVGFPDLNAALAVFDAFFNELRYPGSVHRVEGLGQEHGLMLQAVVQELRSYAEGKK